MKNFFISFVAAVVFSLSANAQDAHSTIRREVDHSVDDQSRAERALRLDRRRDEMENHKENHRKHYREKYRDRRQHKQDHRSDFREGRRDDNRDHHDFRRLQEKGENITPKARKERRGHQFKNNKRWQKMTPSEREEWMNMSRDQRKAKRREWLEQSKMWQNMSPEQRSKWDSLTPNQKRSKRQAYKSQKPKKYMLRNMNPSEKGRWRKNKRQQRKGKRASSSESNSGDQKRPEMRNNRIKEQQKFDRVRENARSARNRRDHRVGSQDNEISTMAKESE